MKQKVIEWVLSKFMDATSDELYGQLVFYFEKGALIRVKIEKTELTPKC